MQHKQQQIHHSVLTALYCYRDIKQELNCLKQVGLLWLLSLTFCSTQVLELYVVTTASKLLCLLNICWSRTCRSNWSKVGTKKISLFNLYENTVQKIFITLALFYWWGNDDIRWFSLCWKTLFCTNRHKLGVPHSKVAKCMKILKLYSLIGLHYILQVHFRVQTCYYDHRQTHVDKQVSALGQKLFSTQQWFTLIQLHLPVEWNENFTNLSFVSFFNLSRFLFRNQNP